MHSTCIICESAAPKPHKDNHPICWRCKGGIANYRPKDQRELVRKAKHARERMFWIYAARFGVDAMAKIIPPKP